MEDSDRFFFTKELLQKMLKKGADRSDEDLQEISDEPNIDLDMEDSDRFFFTKELLQKMLKKGADRSDEDLQEISDEPNIDLDMEDSEILLHQGASSKNV